MEPLVLSVAEAACQLGVSRAHLYELIRTGRVRAVRLGRRIVVPQRVIEALLREDDA